MKIGIIGCGFVGSAVKAAYRKVNVSCIVNDPQKGYTASHDELNSCDAIFICVPSPQRPDGSCDTSILEDVVNQFKDYTGVLISKVTAPPSVYTNLQKVTKHLVYAPEFLTAANATNDYINSTFLVVGGDHEMALRAGNYILLTLPNVFHVEICSIEEASMMKYTINSFLATKVAFMNELFLLCHKVGIDYSVVSRLIKLDDRIGTSHLQVPGPDGLMGFGGACFPKDTCALLSYARENDHILSILKAAVTKNHTLRKDI